MIPLLALLLVATQDAAPSASERAFVELVAPRASCFPGETLPLVIRFGVEREFLQHNLLQLFTRPLEVPVQLDLPWVALAGAEILAPAEPANASSLGARPIFALGEGLVSATRSREEARAGKPWVVLELERELVPNAPGTLALPGPILRFAYATRFEQDLAAGSVPLDKQGASLTATPLIVEVEPFPSAGRPPGFVDAVGHFTLHAECTPRTLAAGEHLQLSLAIEGTGNLARLTPPRLDVLEGLHLLGTREELAGSTRTLHAELVLESPRTKEVPSIELCYLDPATKGYSRASTEAIPLEVRGAAPAEPVGFSARGSLLFLLSLVALLVLAIGWGIAKRLGRGRDRRDGEPS